ncbi:MAG: type II toxin-antitoxin system RelE/ParE family toxin [Planctomycetes bacterium]|nr:type II toxin-antitoxin system RelE/ParE family toxin [Planctomycetota bacterium]
MAKVTLMRQAAQELESLPLVIHVRVLSLLERLAYWPAVSGAKPLTGPLSGRYRLRTGDYRLQFRVQGGTVIVEKIGHRSRFYK